MKTLAGQVDDGHGVTYAPLHRAIVFSRFRWTPRVASLVCRDILVARMNRLEFQSLAAERLDDAAALLQAGRYAGAYYISGYAIECDLKACIAGRTKQDEFPPKEAAKYYVHDLPKLLDFAGLAPAFELDAGRDPALGANWAIVKDWTEEARYAGGGNSRRVKSLVLLTMSGMECCNG